ncbi:MAG: hypothetical protein MJ248_06340 [Bacilli bacterium]|nr:hypothetical protein [Bacilli bacterium]
MKRKSVIELLGVVAVACSLFGCNKQVKEKEYTVKFINLDGSLIDETIYKGGHTIVPPDDIQDYDVNSECHRYFFKGYYDLDNQTPFSIGTKATKNATYQAKFDIKDKHIFNSVNYSWSDSECLAEANCIFCNNKISETGHSVRVDDKETPCYEQYHFESTFDTIGFDTQTSESKRTVVGEHAFTKDFAKDYIGKSGKFYCEYCGDLNPTSVSPKANASTVNEVNFAFDTFGSQVSLVGSSGAYKGETKLLEGAVRQNLNSPSSLLFKTSLADKYEIGYAEIKLELPRVNYNLYKQVSFDILFDDATYGVSFKERTWYEVGTADISGIFVDTTLEINYDSTLGNYNAVIKHKDKSIERETPLESEIVDGSKSLEIHFNSMFFNDVTISNLSLIEK